MNVLCENQLNGKALCSVGLHPEVEDHLELKGGSEHCMGPFTST